MPDSPDPNEQPTPPPPSSQMPSNRTAMIILAYLGFLALIPLLVEKEDADIQWHAKHGLVLMLSWMLLFVALAIISSIPGLGLVIGCGVSPFLMLIIFFVHVFAIVKGLDGERLLVPVISDYADRW